MQASLRKSATKPRPWVIRGSAEPGIPMGVRDNISANLRRLILKSGLKQREFGVAIGVSEQVVSQWVNGRACPEYKQLDTIAAALSTSYEELVRSPDEPPAAAIPARDLDTILRELAKARGFELVPKSRKNRARSDLRS